MYKTFSPFWSIIHRERDCCFLSFYEVVSHTTIYTYFRTTYNRTQTCSKYFCRERERDARFLISPSTCHSPSNHSLFLLTHPVYASSTLPRVSLSLFPVLLDFQMSLPIFLSRINLDLWLNYFPPKTSIHTATTVYFPPPIRISTLNIGMHGIPSHPYENTFLLLYITSKTIDGIYSHTNY